MARLTEVAWPAVARTWQGAMMQGWLKALPDELVLRRPLYSVLFAGAALIGGHPQAVESRLRDAERWLETTCKL